MRDKHMIHCKSLEMEKIQACIQKKKVSLRTQNLKNSQKIEKEVFYFFQIVLSFLLLII